MNHRSLAFRLAVWYALLLSATFTLVGTACSTDSSAICAPVCATRCSGARSGRADSRAGAGGSSNADIAAAITTRVAPEFNNRFVRVTRAPAESGVSGWGPADHSFDAGRHSGAERDDWPGKSLVRPMRPRAAGSCSADAHRHPIGPLSDRTRRLARPVEALQHRLLRLLGLLLPILVACAAGGGYLLVHLALRPVERMSRTAEQISVQNLDARLPVVPSATLCNDCRCRSTTCSRACATRFRASRRFLADASHELRTPLPSSRANCRKSSATRESATPGDVRERIGSVLEEVAGSSIWCRDYWCCRDSTPATPSANGWT